MASGGERYIELSRAAYAELLSKMKTEENWFTQTKDGKKGHVFYVPISETGAQRMLVIGHE